MKDLLGHSSNSPDSRATVPEISVGREISIRNKSICLCAYHRLSSNEFSMDFQKSSLKMFAHDVIQGV